MKFCYVLKAQESFDISVHLSYSQILCRIVISLKKLSGVLAQNASYGMFKEHAFAITVASMHLYKVIEFNRFASECIIGNCI